MQVIDQQKIMEAIDKKYKLMTKTQDTENIVLFI